ncbi:MAG: hypothetical protein M5R37_11785 [Melioribacteraceae bacterium]|jgi:hypothetical protein|nr:hypothetical protein [Melioribacteraceae bacterium]
MVKIISFLLLSIMLSLSSLAQGKIFLEDEAEQLFGPVKQKTRLNTRVFEAFIDTHEHLMFKMDKAKINVLGRNRIPIIKQFESSADEVYHLFSSEVIRELIGKGKNPNTYIETREEVLSISNGIYVMEIAFPCPPCCPECPDWPWPPKDE